MSCRVVSCRVVLSGWAGGGDALVEGGWWGLFSGSTFCFVAVGGTSLWLGGQTFVCRSGRMVPHLLLGVVLRVLGDAGHGAARDVTAARGT